VFRDKEGMNCALSCFGHFGGNYLCRHSSFSGNIAL